MYTILIVEDETLELHALTKLVGAHASRIKTIYQARDSQEALSQAREHAPDIILMDINIPGCSGLEVLETLRREGYSGAVVIITAYSQFEYAQIALRADAIDYLLKPIASDELNSCLRKVFEKLDAQHHIQHQISQLQNRIRSMSSYLQPIAMESLLSGKAAESSMHTLFDWPKDGSLQAAVLRFSFESKLDMDEQKCFYFDLYSLCPSYFSLIASISPSEILIAVHSTKQMDNSQFELLLWCIAVRMQQFSAKRGYTCHVAGSGVITEYAEFASFAEKQCSGTSNNSIVLPLESLRRGNPLSSKELRTRYSKAQMRCKAGMPEKIVSIFKSLLAEPSSQWAGLFCILDVLHGFDANANLLDAYHAIVQSDAGLSSAASTWIEENASCAIAAPKASSKGFIIDQALEIIQNEYSNPMLSQADISDHLGLSQAYFSRLFKKEMGETFIAYLTQTRMSHAKLLLCDGQPVQAIAEACGYQSKKYFLDVFRQSTGMSIAQYLDEVNRE